VIKILKFSAMLLGATSLFVSGVIPTSAADQQGLTIEKVESCNKQPLTMLCKPCEKPTYQQKYFCWYY